MRCSIGGAELSPDRERVNFSDVLILISLKEDKIVRTDLLYRLEGKRVWVAGDTGMAGSAIMRRLEREDCEILKVPRSEVDLRRQADTEAWLEGTRPQAIFLAAAKVGGILANATWPADFLYDNLLIEANTIHAAYATGVEKLLFLASSSVYPRLTPQPIGEDALLSGPLEATNQWYAVAKIAGIKLCQAYRRQYQADFISVLPTNLYGPGDHFDPETSHVIPALMRRIYEVNVEGGETVEIWGSGKPRREFMHVDDFADACVHLMKHYSDEPILNIGTGSDITIRELAEMLRDVIGYRGGFVYDASKPDGTPGKLLDVARLRQLGWEARISLPCGLRDAYRWFLAHAARPRLQ